MQGRLRGVATQIQQDVAQALPIHCLSHSLNLHLQDSIESYLDSDINWHLNA